MSYAVCVLVGVALSLIARRLAPEPAVPHAWALSLIAMVGATAGAFVFEVPADLYGWTVGLAGEPMAAEAIGGRTVLGGLLGGWLAVEAGKRGLGIGRPTGDGFALPLAIGLACGRMGCFFRGCCAGKRAVGGEWWSGLAMLGHDGVPRFPAQLAEVAFHLSAGVVLFVLARRGALRHRRFAAYVALYAVFRAAIEELRGNPAVLLGLTYYQILAAPLFALAASTLVARSRADGASPAAERREPVITEA